MLNGVIPRDSWLRMRLFSKRRPGISQGWPTQARRLHLAWRGYQDPE